jgi:hypothetical protein
MKKFLRKWLPKIGLAFKADQDWAYEQRDIAAMSAAAFAIQAGYHVDYYRDNQENWDEDWRWVLQISGFDNIDESQGQISWHLGPQSKKVADECFAKVNLVPWDGTDLSKDLNVVKRIAL